MKDDDEHKISYERDNRGQERSRLNGVRSISRVASQTGGGCLGCHDSVRLFRTPHPYSYAPYFWTTARVIECLAVGWLETYLIRLCRADNAVSAQLGEVPSHSEDGR